mgnify:FL=1
MCIFSRRQAMPMPEPKVDPAVEKAKAEETAMQENIKKKSDAYKARVQGGQVGRRSLISGESGGIGYVK